MSRSFEERVLLYFYKKALSSSLFLLVLALAFFSVGYSRDEGGMLFTVIGVGMFIMGIWHAIRTSMTKIKGSEVDESAERFLKSTNVEKNAVLAWELDDEQYGRMEVMNLDGYCPLAIETEPLFRIDEEDKKARSSNYQASYFALDGGMILTYTAVKSLVDAEYTDSSHIWRIASITDVRIEKLVRRCALTPGRESEKADGDFNALTIRGENGEYFVYSFREEQREDAELLCRTILKRMDRNARLRKPVRKGAGRIVLEDAGPLTKKQIAAWNVGVIGDEMDDL